MSEDDDKNNINCILTKDDLDLISESLMHLYSSNGDYLNWKKDSFSQQEIPKKMNKLKDLYDKIHKLR